MGKYGKRNHVKLDPLAYNICLLGESKVGKEQPVSEPILTENGWIPMGDIKIGTKVYGEDGKLHNVTGIYPQGVKDVYQVTFRDGTTTRCGLEHLWTVTTKKQRELMRKNNDLRCKTLTLQEIMQDYRRENLSFIRCRRGKYAYKYSVPVNQPIDFTMYHEDGLPIDAYALGLLLGDGGFTQNVVTFTNAEQELFDEIENALRPLNVYLKYREFEHHRQANICSNDNHNALTEHLRRLNLYGCDSRHKFIPKCYLYNSIEQRARLLSGIINTDGHVNNTTISVSSCSKMLADNVAELARSLGFIASIKEYQRPDKVIKKYDETTEYSVHIIGDDYSMLHLSSKHKNRLHPKKTPYVKSIVNIEKVGREESQCIMLDNPNHLYITNDYIVTHNTTLIKEVCEKLAGDEGYLFLECGQERGADAIEGIIYEDVPDWDCFEEICDDIIDNKSADYANLKVVVIDTYDQLITLAEQESIRLWNVDNPDKRAKSINAAWGGFGRGDKKAIELMFDKIAELRSVGVSTIIIGHIKNKDVSDPVSGETYQILTSDQQQNYFNALKKNLHFLGLAYIDRQIVKQKTGQKKVVDGVKQDVEINRTIGESRKIKFRDDNFCVDSGSRFANIVSEIDLNADQFIQAITDAIKAEQAKSGKTLEETKAEQDADEVKRLKEIAEKEKAKKAEKQLNTVISQITNYIKANKSDMEVIKPIIKLTKELGYDNPTMISDITDANKVLALIS